MAMSAEFRSKYTALHQWWHLQMSEKFSSGTKNSNQTNKQILSDMNWLLWWKPSELVPWLLYGSQNITVHYCQNMKKDFPGIKL